MVKNDLQFVFPDQNGERICQLACQQLGYTAVKVANKMSNVADSSADSKTTSEMVLGTDGNDGSDNLSQGGTKRNAESDEFGPQQWATTLLAATTKLVTSVQKSLDACRQEQIALPAQLNLALSKNTQFIDGASRCTKCDSSNEPFYFAACASRCLNNHDVLLQVYCGRPSGTILILGNSVTSCATCQSTSYSCLFAPRRVIKLREHSGCAIDLRHSSTTSLSVSRMASFSYFLSLSTSLPKWYVVLAVKTAAYQAACLLRCIAGCPVEFCDCTFVCRFRSRNLDTQTTCVLGTTQRLQLWPLKGRKNENKTAWH